MAFIAIVCAASVLAGSIASVAGFGIGSVLTPLLATRLGMRVAVAAVSIPHLAGTALRFWLVRRHLDRRVLFTFGVTSAAGGLVGALLQSRASNAALTIVLAVLLFVAGVTELLGPARRPRLPAAVAWIGGALSGLFGGLVGNQGGIRSAALLAFPLDRQTFVATATAIALVVDGARMPVYLVASGADVAPHAPIVALAVAGVTIGTIAGGRVLRRMGELAFRRTVAALLLALSAWLVSQA
jgi:hypothetical protein